MNRRTDEDRKRSTTLAEAAGAWDARLRSPDCTDQDRARFAEWCDADPAHRPAFERLQSVVATLRHDRGRADLRSLRDEALRVVSHRRRRVWLGTAAAAVMAIAVGAALWNSANQNWLSEPVAALVTRLSGAQSYSTGTGQRSTFVLDDGSSIELNARSRLEVRFSDTRRDVKLIAGQALFNVARDRRRPFVVQAGDRRVFAVGTQFDVRLDGLSVQVTLLEGKVRVEDSAPLPEQARKIELAPGQQLVAKLGTADRDEVPALPATPDSAGASPDIVRDIDVAKVTGWREGRIFFDDLSLEDAVTEMNRHSAVHIRLESPALAGLRVNGMFKAGEQESFVAALQEYFPIEAERRGAREIVLVAR